MTIILALMYPLAVQYERGGWWVVLAPFTFMALVIDIVANYTELALLTWDLPRQYEYTFSTRLVRLRRAPGWRGVVCSKVANILDTLAPGGRHIK